MQVHKDGVQLLHFDGSPHWRVTEERPREALSLSARTPNGDDLP